MTSRSWEKEREVLEVNAIPMAGTESARAVILVIPHSLRCRLSLGLRWKPQFKLEPQLMLPEPGQVQTLCLHFLEAFLSGVCLARVREGCLSGP